MQEIITKQLADELMRIKGEVRGIAPKAHVQFVVEEKGESIFEKVEDKMAELGHPVNYKSLRPMNFYPIGIEAITLLVIKQLFNYDDEKFKEIGKYQSKISLIIKLFTKYFVSIKIIAQKAPEMWRKYYTVGDLKVTELNEKEKYTVVEVKDFKMHEHHCRMLEGYFASVIKMVVKENTICKETKCIFKGDDYHEFLIKW
ncbi:MAG: hypothetical protein KJI70_00110 [Patescibacteria group bacterium]|nr:hypothetical protein [Patescibacteria group bacterium]